MPATAWRRVAGSAWPSARGTGLVIALVLAGLLIGCGDDDAGEGQADEQEESAGPTREQRACVEESGVAQIADSFEHFGSADATVAEGGGVRSFLADAYPDALSDGGDPPVIDGVEGIPASGERGEAAAFVYDSPDDAAEAASLLGWDGNSRVRGNVLLVVDPEVRLDPLAQDTIVDCLGSEEALEADTSDEEPGPAAAEIAQCLREAGQEVEEAGAAPFTSGGGLAAAEQLHVEFQPEPAEFAGTLPMNLYVPAVEDIPGVSPGEAADVVELELSEPTIAGPLYRAGNTVVSYADAGVPDALRDAVERCVSSDAS